MIVRSSLSIGRRCERMIVGTCYVLAYRWVVERSRFWRRSIRNRRWLHLAQRKHFCVNFSNFSLRRYAQYWSPMPDFAPPGFALWLAWGGTTSAVYVTRLASSLKVAVIGWATANSIETRLPKHSVSKM